LHSPRHTFSLCALTTIFAAHVLPPEQHPLRSQPRTSRHDHPAQHSHKTHHISAVGRFGPNQTWLKLVVWLGVPRHHPWACNLPGCKKGKAVTQNFSHNHTISHRGTQPKYHRNPLPTRPLKSKVQPRITHTQTPTDPRTNPASLPHKLHIVCDPTTHDELSAISHPTTALSSCRTPLSHTSFSRTPTRSIARKPQRKLSHTPRDRSHKICDPTLHLTGKPSHAHMTPLHKVSPTTPVP
jgi:hypothetical protein